MVVSRTKVFKKNLTLNRRGDWNVPKRFLKEAPWATVGDDTGYFVKFKGVYFPIEFDFTNYFWFLVKYNNQDSCWESNKLPNEDYGLNIQDYEIINSSNWGPIDGEKPDDSNPEYSKSKGHPESINIKIPTKEKEKSESQLEKLAESIPNLTRPRSNTATSRLPPITTIMTTQTVTEPTQAIAAEGEHTFAWRGGGPPEEDPNPRWFGWSGNPFNLPERSGEGSGGGGGGSGIGGEDLNDQNLRNKLSGKEPVVFDRDCSKAEAFMLEWMIYMLLNKETKVMSQVFSRTMLFLTFIKGPNVQVWVGLQVGWLGRRNHQGASRREEYLYDTIIDSFNSAFTDTMSKQKAKSEFQTIKMEGGDLDTYVAKFERLAWLAGYDLQNQLILNSFSSRLTSGLSIHCHCQQCWRTTKLDQVDLHCPKFPTEVPTHLHKSGDERSKRFEAMQKTTNSRAVESGLERQRDQTPQCHGYHSRPHLSQENWCGWENRTHESRQVFHLQETRTS